MPSHRSLTIRSYPKVNLALDILRKDPSGFHEIQTIFHELKEPFDEIILEARDDGQIIVESDNPKVPRDKTNTVFKAALLLQQYAGVKKGAKIFIKKRIPLMSGLGGGASNAVAALKGLAKLWKIECCTSDNVTQYSSRLLRPSKNWARNDIHHSSCLLPRLALQIGMDCAFFFHGGTALGTHFGEKITPLPLLPKSIKLKIIDTGIEISSRWAYENIDLARCRKNTEKTQKLIAALKAGDAEEIVKNFHNDFEVLIFAEHPELLRKKKALSPAGFALLTGSGGALLVSKLEF